ncbi:hypothetical protein PK35_08865 [Tamlana nanhaiensis]|uniref:Uncharacterized protein n=1 Tax=Neotamlana nanhaiensis TaxID=1382798 RepID=A0A0D7W1V0_9FLAO|nr:hypothetical protein [Tamlana nanhaiensis]KJD33066.1 hypothetical protein PK35_08865 [Tamlana nanhaiensis]
MKYLNYILIVVGAIVAMYAKAGANQNQYLLIGGIVLLMVGAYRISKTISSKKDADNDDTSNLDNN